MDMSSYANMNPMAVPPPPPPPPKPIQSEMGQMMDGYDQDALKMGVGVSHDSFGSMSAPTFVPPFIPQPPSAPPPAPMVHHMGMLNPAMGLMVPHMGLQPGQMGRQLIDPYLAAEISSIVHTLSTSQLIYVLAALKKFLKHAPSEARRFLINNPQLTYALLHTQFILGEHDESVLPLSKLDHDISQVNRLERSGHLKPFHNLYEENSLKAEPLDHYGHTDQYKQEYQMKYEQPQQVHPVENENLRHQHQQHQQSQSQHHHHSQSQKHQPSHSQHHQHVSHSQHQTSHHQEQTQQLSNEATQKDIDDLMNSGVYPASAPLVDAVIKNNDLLTNIQKATREEMTSWPAEQKQQVLSIKVALHMRGISVNL